MKINLCYLLLVLSLSHYSNCFAQQPAFPGAEGFGKYATGGRGGKVYTVTNLNDAGPGSFREAFNSYPREPLTIVFAVGGIIELQSQIKVNRSNFTIAGQTAPGDGICLKGHSFIVNGARSASLGGNHGNIIIRHLRSRPGSTLSTGVYGFDLENCHNVIIDHCSFSWANEECAAMYDMENVTVQYSIISEGLFNAGHAKGNRGYGGVWGGQYATYHHNLFAHLNARSTRFNGARAHDVNALIDYRNNVIYNAGTRNAAAGGAVNIDGAFSRINLVNNYYKPGPATPSDYLFLEADYEPAEAKGVGEFYVAGNIMHGKASQTNDNWTAVSLTKIPTEFQSIAKSNTEFAIAQALPSKTAAAAYADVLKNVGALLPVRDAVDKRIVSETATGTANKNGVSSGKAGIIDAPSEVGGWPVYSTGTALIDTDGDGMPDSWELANSLNPNNPADGNHLGGDGYTRLETYLNSIANPVDEVEILGFSASLNQGSTTTATLKWVINDDSGINSFSLERSQSGVVFTEVNNQLSENNSGISEYIYNDNSPLAFLSYYRLKITDNNNVISYSEVKELNNPISQAYWTEPFTTTTVTTILQPATVQTSVQSNGSWILYGAKREERNVTDVDANNQWTNGSTNPSLQILNGNAATVQQYGLTVAPYVITPIFSQGISKITFNEIMRTSISANSIEIYTSTDGGTTWSATPIKTATKNSKFDLITVPITGSGINRLKIAKPAGVTMNIDNLSIYAPVGVTLPLQFLSFEVTLKRDISNTAALTWSTANEVNTDEFVIERSADGKLFMAIGSKKTQNKEGKHQYFFTDENPLEGYNYYRLKQLDFDAKYTYSDIKVINNKSQSSFNIYPNPASDDIQIKHAIAQEYATIAIYSLKGEKVQEVNLVKNSINSTCSIDNLSPGIYFIQLNNGKDSFSEKFIKQ